MSLGSRSCKTVYDTDSCFAIVRNAIKPNRSSNETSNPNIVGTRSFLLCFVAWTTMRSWETCLTSAPVGDPAIGRSHLGQQLAAIRTLDSLGYFESNSGLSAILTVEIPSFISRDRNSVLLLTIFRKSVGNWAPTRASSWSSSTAHLLANRRSYSSGNKVLVDNSVFALLLRK